jgi:hypothetical protein
LIPLAIGLLFLAAAPYLARLTAVPMPYLNGIKGPDEEPAKLYPACDYYPDGLNGQPCVDSQEHERTGHLVFYEHWTGPRLNDPHCVKGGIASVTTSCNSDPQMSMMPRN